MTCFAVVMLITGHFRVTCSSDIAFCSLVRDQDMYVVAKAGIRKPKFNKKARPSASIYADILVAVTFLTIHRSLKLIPSVAFTPKETSHLQLN